MGKWVADDVLDSALGVIGSATRMVAVAGQPQDFAAAWNGRLAEAPLSASDFAITGGQASGRRIEISTKGDIGVEAAGLADHVALLDLAGERLLYVTTCPAQMLSAGGSVTFDGWSVEIGAAL